MFSQARFHIRQSWLIRIYFFIFLGGTSFLRPYLNLFFQRQGLNGTQIGLLGTVGALIGLVVAPLWANWSDQMVHPRRLLQAAFLGSAIAYLLLSQQVDLRWMALLVGLNALLLSGTDPISDNLALKAGDVESGGRQSRFGSIRLWGSLGWAVMVYFAGWMIERTGIQSVFFGYAVSVLLIIVVLNYLQPARKSAIPQVEPRVEVLQKGILRQLVSDKALVGLVFALGVQMLTRSGTYQFRAIYMDELGARESLIGLVGTLEALVEIPALLWADRLVHKYGSHRILLLGFIVGAINMAGIVLVPHISTFLIMAVLSGIGFSFYNVSLVVFIDERAPLGKTATMLALYNSTLRGAVLMLAAPLNGMIYDYFGANWLYVSAMTGSLMGFWFSGYLFPVKEAVLDLISGFLDGNSSDRQPGLFTIDG